MRCSISVALAALAVLAVTPVASAATLSMDGGTLVLTAAPGEANDVLLSTWTDVDTGQRSLIISDAAGITASPAGCTTEPNYEDPAEHRICPVPAGFRAALGDGDDDFSEFDSEPQSFPIEVALGAGADRAFGSSESSVGSIFDGGPGNDKLEGGAGNDTLRGGADDDIVDGVGGNDRVLGEAGNDSVSGDRYEAQGTDVIDGGPGLDRIEQDWAKSGVTPPAAVTVSLDGAANDGRAGEGDNVVAVESIINNAPGSYNGSDLDESWNVAAEGAATVNGAGGADTIRTHRGRDTIDGGAGPDDIEGGYGDDTITGGPGRDLIVADEKQTGCSGFSCDIPFGNDTILARDGEVDSVTCGFGADRVVADANDVVAGDCDKVERAATPGGGGSTADDRQTIVGVTSKGLKVKVRCARKCKVSIVAMVSRATARKLRLGRKATVVGKGRASLKSKGTKMVTVKLTARAKKALKKAKKVTVKLKIRTTYGKRSKTKSRSVTIRS